MLLVLLGPYPAAGQVQLERPSVRLDARYDNIEQGTVRQRLQLGVRLQQQVTFFDAVDLVLFAATGDEFASRWVTAYDLRPDEDDVDLFRLHLRRAYLQVNRPRYRVQVGAVPPVKAVISPTGLDPAGWVDGARFEWYYAEGGTMELVFGRLGSIETPSVFDRPMPLVGSAADYAEMEVSHHVRPWLRLEGSAEYLDGPYLRSEIRWMPTEADELFFEVLYNLEEGAVNYGTTLAGDPLHAWLGGEAGRTTVELKHTFTGREIGLRGELADDFVTYGHAGTGIVDVVLSRRLGLGAGLEAIVAEATGEGRPGDGVYTRFKIELSWRLP